MKHKTFAVLGALALSLSALANTVQAFGEPIEGKCLTQQEAEKIMKMPKGGYPTAQFGTQGTSLVPSPYNSSRMIDCTKCSRGGLVLDPMANKVFRNP